ncbi:MAG: single-stranded-DNA-specific exonuclease RecJ [Myxococcota bacterium]
MGTVDVGSASHPSSPEVCSVLPRDELAAATLGRACDLGASAAQVLLHRGFGEPTEAHDFLDASLRGLSSPDTMADRAAAADRLARAVRNRERVVVFGDYDVDGTTSALILAEVLRALGGDAQIVIADRFRGGYGLSDAGLDRCLEADPAVLVTCDCGSSDHRRIERARDCGIDVLVVDHHLVPHEPLPALAFLNPNRPECGFGFKGLCSAGLAFSLGAAVRSELGAKIDLRPWLDLVAIGTIADLAPLTGDNRRLVRAGLRRLGSPGTRPALRALRQVTKLRDSPYITARDVAFRLAPRLNAPGRLGHADLTLRLLAADTAAEAWRLVEEVERANDERKALTAQATDEARAQALEVYGEAPEGGIVVASDAWHRGVVGIVAARLVDTWGVPAVVIAWDGDEGHGSARTPEGFDVYRAIAASADALEGWGGHRAAAGLSLHKARFEAFRSAFSAASAQTPTDVASPKAADVELGGVYGVPSIDDLCRLGPFGEAFPTPKFLVHAHLVSATGVGEGKAHAKLQLRVADASVRAFAPQMYERLAGRETATLVGEFQPDHFIGGQAIEFLVTDVID